MRPYRILILFGGCSSEHEVSLRSGAAVLSQLDRSRFEPVPVGITREGQWLLSRHGEDFHSGTPCTLNLARGSRELLLLDGTGQRIGIDAAFPVLHGKNGEDGTVQGACELAGLPLVGCGTLASALCMDKARAHRLAAAAGIRVPKSLCFSKHSVAESGTPEGGPTKDNAAEGGAAENGAPETIQNAAAALGFPLFVKPVRAGSSFGVSRVESAEQLAAAVDNAFRYDTEVLLEEAVPGFEVGCAVMGNEVLTVGAVDEIELASGFFDFTEKYGLETASIHCPARIPPRKAAEVQNAARTIYRALGCRGMARVDFFLTPAGEIVFNEVNTVPGFTAHSRFPAMMREIGIPFQELLTRLVLLGVQG